MWYILNIEGEVFTLSKGGQKQFQTTIMGAANMNVFNLSSLLRAACDAQDASELNPVIDLSQIIGAKVMSLGE